jgi:protein TonB
MAIRLSLSTIVGILVTLALFYLMQALIAGADKALKEDAIGNLVDFVRVKEELEIQTKSRQPEKPPPPDEPPPEVPPSKFETDIDSTGYTLNDLNITPDIDIHGGGFGISDGEYLPIVKVLPQYPRRAQARGMSGWVILEFTVSAQGMVQDPIVVSNCGWVKTARTEGECEGKPNPVFDSAAIKAALKFKYKPKIIDGNPVDTTGVLHKLTFDLSDDGV